MPSATTPEHDEQEHSATPEVASVCAEGAPARRFGLGLVIGRDWKWRTRFALRCLVFGPLFAVLAGLLLMRSAAVGWLAGDQLRAALGCEVSTEASAVTFDGRIVLRGLSLRVPGMTGPEGEFLHAERAEIDVDWSDALSGGVRPAAIRLYRPVFRVSVSEIESELNIQGLHPTDPDAISGDQSLRIDVHAGRLELGEHSDVGYKSLRAIGISGEVVPSEKEPGLYRVKFRELPATSSGLALPQDVGMMLTGRVDLRSSIAVVDLLNVNLDAWDSASVPSALRDVWRQLNIKGRIESTSIEYFPSTGPRAVVTLASVSMDAIVPAEYPTGQATDDVLSLRNVYGKVSLTRDGLVADVAGQLEEQPYQSRVMLKTRDMSTDAALECKIVTRGFKLEKESTLLPFCPPIVRERLGNFCGPTAVVDADVIIRRDSPGRDGPAPFKVAGWMTFQNGTAAFDRVPYPFTEMQGRVEFDDDGIDILRIRGVGKDGAVLTARGRIAPPTDDAAVDVDITVKNMPLDETFMNSLPESRKEAIDFLFNRERYNELLAAGLVSATPTKDGPPVFMPGGRMDLEIAVQSPQGKDAPWHYTVDVTLPQAGVLTRAFPLPIAAKNIRLQLTDQEARLMAGEFRGLRGGVTDVDAGVVLEVDGNPVIRPSVTIDAKQLPIDDLLLHAIEYASGRGKGQERSSQDDAPSPAKLLRTLQLKGDVDCRTEIRSTSEESIDFDIGVVFDELSATPSAAGAEPAITLADIAGSIHLTNTRVDVPRLTAGIRALDGAAALNPAIAPGADLGWISATLTGQLRGIDTSMTAQSDDAVRMPASIADVHATLDLAGIEMGAAFERSVGAFSTSIADEIAEIRAKHQPTGRLSAVVDVRKAASTDPVDFVVRMTAAENLGFDVPGGRLETSLRSGEVVVDSRQANTAVFRKAAIEVGAGDDARSPLLLDGSLLLEEAADSERADYLTIDGRDVPVDSSLVEFVVRRAAGDESLDVVTRAKPAGRFDVSVKLPASILVDDSDAAFEAVAATITPRSLQFDFEGSRVDVKSFEGGIAVAQGKISLDGLVAKAEDWTLGVDGAWRRGVDGVGVFAADLDIQAASLTPGICALLPEGLREELDTIELKIEGPLRVTDAKVIYRAGEGESSVVGDLHFAEASLDIGAPLTEADGVLSLHARRRSGTGGGNASGWAFDMDIEADRVVAAGLEMTSLNAKLTVGENPGELLLRELWADCYAGRVTARAKVTSNPDEPSPDQESAATAGSFYDADITFAGVCFAPVLAALEAARARTAGEAPEPMSAELSTDPSRGRLDGTLAISGLGGRSDMRSGVGSVRIAGGDVVEMPLVLTLVQLSNLQFPSDDQLDFMQAIFHVNKERVIFDQIDLLSSSVTISGRGTMSWPGQELDLRFNSRAGNRMPLVSDLVETLRDEIATTRIRGTLGAPRVGSEPLIGTRKLIGSLVGDRAERRATGLPDSRTERARHRSHRPQPAANQVTHGQGTND